MWSMTINTSLFIPGLSHVSKLVTWRRKEEGEREAAQQFPTFRVSDLGIIFRDLAYSHTYPLWAQIHWWWFWIWEVNKQYLESIGWIIRTGSWGHKSLIFTEHSCCKEGYSEQGYFWRIEQGTDFAGVWVIGWVWYEKDLSSHLCHVEPQFSHLQNGGSDGMCLVLWGFNEPRHIKSLTGSEIA